MDKERIRPIFGTLKGYFSVAPNPEKNPRIYDSEIWNGYNRTVDKLNELNDSFDHYRDFRVIPRTDYAKGRTEPFIMTQDYITKLGGLIGRIQEEYFWDDKNNISNSIPTTIINQNQYQKQEQTILVDLAMFIADKKAIYEEGTSERNFLDQLGEVIKGTTGIVDVIKSIISLATSCGLTMQSVAKIFGL